VPLQSKPTVIINYSLSFLSSGSCAESSDSLFPTFQDSVSLPSSRFTKTKKI